jgi:hypothetical protein
MTDNPGYSTRHFLTTVRGTPRDGAVILHLDDIPWWILPRQGLAHDRVYKAGETAKHGAIWKVVDGRPRVVQPSVPIETAVPSFDQSNFPPGEAPVRFGLSIWGFSDGEVVP